MLKKQMVGSTYRHFKGTLYQVIDIAIHSENAEPLVIYKGVADSEYTWARPLSMFISEVDRKKYPDVAQQMRFEKVS